MVLTLPRSAWGGVGPLSISEGLGSCLPGRALERMAPLEYQVRRISNNIEMQVRPGIGKVLIRPLTSHGALP